MQYVRGVRGSFSHHAYCSQQKTLWKVYLNNRKWPLVVRVWKRHRPFCSQSEESCGCPGARDRKTLAVALAERHHPFCSQSEENCGCLTGGRGKIAAVARAVHHPSCSQTEKVVETLPRGAAARSQLPHMNATTHFVLSKKKQVKGRTVDANEIDRTYVALGRYSICLNAKCFHPSSSGARPHSES